MNNKDINELKSMANELKLMLNEDNERENKLIQDNYKRENKLIQDNYNSYVNSMNKQLFTLAQLMVKC